MSKKPKVSIVTTAYNHEQFIGQALESFVTQKTSFPFEVIVADDCSPDGTAAVIEKYAKKYPDIIKPILRKKNIGAVNNTVEALQSAKGDYVALCEGDDYWTSPDKLQKQADLLDSDPDMALCFHPVKVFFDDNSGEDYIYPKKTNPKNFTVDELLRWNFIQTNSVMYRRQSYDKVPRDILPLDWYLHLYHAQFGKIGFIDEVMSAYRRHAGGMWWDSDRDIDALLQRHGLALLGLYLEVLNLFGDEPERAKAIYYRVNDLIAKFHAIDKKHGTLLVKQALKKYPKMIQSFMLYQTHELIERENVMHGQEDQLKVRARELNARGAEVRSLSEQLQKTIEELSGLSGKAKHEAVSGADAKALERPLRIMIASHSPELGGAELAVIDMLKYLEKQYGIEPHFILPAREKLAHVVKQNGWKFSVVPYGVWAWHKLPKKAEDIYRERSRNLSAVKKLVGVIKKQQPDIVLTNTIVTPWAALAASVAGVPHVWYVHEYGDLDHGLEFELGRDKTLKDIGLLSELVIANSLAIQEHLTGYIPVEKLHTSYIPYDVAEVNERAGMSDVSVFATDTALKLVLVGRITPSKGQLDAVLAVGELVKRGINAQLCLVGGIQDEAYHQKIKTTIAKQGLTKNIIFVSHTDNPFTIIKSADVGLMPSRLEAFGRVTFEYLLLGKPVVGTKSGGTPEIVRDGENGFTFEYGKPKELADRLVEYVNNPALIVEHGKRAAEHANEMLSGEHGADNLYQQLLYVSRQQGSKQTFPAFVEELFRFPEVVRAYHRHHPPVSPRGVVLWGLKAIYRRSPYPVRKVVKKAVSQRRRARTLLSKGVKK